MAAWRSRAASTVPWPWIASSPRGSEQERVPPVSNPVIASRACGEAIQGDRTNRACCTPGLLCRQAAPRNDGDSFIHEGRPAAGSELAMTVEVWAGSPPIFGSSEIRRLARCVVVPRAQLEVHAARRSEDALRDLEQACGLFGRGVPCTRGPESLPRFLLHRSTVRAGPRLQLSAQCFIDIADQNVRQR